MKIIIQISVIAFFVFLSSCAKEAETTKSGPDIANNMVVDEPALDEYDTSRLIDANECGLRVANNSSLTSHFQTWLSSNGYGSYNFVNTSITGDSYGGKANNSTPVNKQPVIFIHGNADKVVGSIYGQSGWTKSLDYFLANGYTQSELYAITWGDANILSSANNYHSKENVMRTRKFIEAVLAYTGASQVDIVGHSMGVTLGRKAVKGGNGYDPNDG